MNRQIDGKIEYQRIFTRRIRTTSAFKYPWMSAKKEKQQKENMNVGTRTHACGLAV